MDYTAALGIIVAIVPIIWATYNYISIKNSENRNTRFTNYHNLIRGITQGDPGEDVVYLDRQTAIAFELKNYPEYAPVTIKILSGFKKRISKKEDCLGYFKTQIDETLTYLEGNHKDSEVPLIESAKRTFGLYFKAFSGAGVLLFLFFFASLSDFSGPSENITNYLVEKSTSVWRFSVIGASLIVLILLHIKKYKVLAYINTVINIIMASLGGFVGLAFIVYCLLVWSGNEVDPQFVFNIFVVMISTAVIPVVIEIVRRTATLNTEDERVVAFVFALFILLFFVISPFIV